MTFRQALIVVRRQWLMIGAVALIALIVAGVFLVVQKSEYRSDATVRFSPLAASAFHTGQIGTGIVDFDPAAITSPIVLDAAGEAVGEPGSTGDWRVEYSTITGGTSEIPTVSITLAASGTSAVGAQQHLEAVIAAYESYLADQTAQAREVAVGEVAKWTTQARNDQEQVDRNPANSIAQSSLASAITALARANDTITRIDAADRPLIVTRAVAPGWREGTNPLLTLAATLLAGIIAGIGIALIRDAFDDRLRPEDDVRILTGAPSLGGLPLDRSVLRGERLPAAKRAHAALNEGLRSLRTTVQVLLPHDRSVAVVVTSVEPGDGKTFISANLALAWSRMGKRVVLIGGDLRHPGLEEHFGEAATGPGLAELLQSAVESGTAPSTATIADHLNETAYPGLRILPTGAEPWDPADLLAQQSVGEVMRGLRELCDVIVVDSPPSLALVDARLLATHADGVLLVASMGRTHRGQLAETAHALRASGTKILGIVLNRSKQPIPQSYSVYYDAALRSTAPAETAKAAPEPKPKPSPVTAAPETDSDAEAPVTAGTTKVAAPRPKPRRGPRDPRTRVATEEKKTS